MEWRAFYAGLPLRVMDLCDEVPGKCFCNKVHVHNCSFRQQAIGNVEKGELTRSPPKH